MGATWKVAAKEWRDYFVSPIAYIVIAVFLLATGWIFFSTFFLVGQASMRNYFDMLPFALAFVAPAVTMRQLAEERHSGSLELLATLPVTGRQIVVGKFLAATALMAAMLVPTLIWPVCIAFFGALDWGTVAGGYLGTVLLAAAYVAVGLLASSLTRNQIVAFIVGMVICFTLAIVDKMLFFMPTGLQQVAGYLAADAHFQNIARGVVDSRDLLYFASVCFIALYLTAEVLDAAKQD